jgi:hypothetical protein
MIQYSPRIVAPDVLQRDTAQTVEMQVYLAGELIAPSSGTFKLLNPDGTDAIAASAVSVTNEVATYAISAGNLPTTLELSDGYVEVWSLIVEGESLVVRREAALSKYPLHCPIADVDFVAGEYPDIVDSLGEYAGSLQGFIDEAWAQIMERLWNSGQWPDLILSSSSLRQPLREMVMHLVMKFLFRKTSGDSRFEILMNLHWDRFNSSYDRMTFKVDNDQDGTADSDNRDSAAKVIHRNVPPYRNLKRRNW